MSLLNPPNPPVRTITIIGRRWFQKTYGNTYHSAEILVNGKNVGRIDYAYGYGNQYLYSAFYWLEKEGYLTLERGNGGHEAPWRWAERNGVELAYSATDVGRKKDL